MKMHRLVRLQKLPPFVNDGMVPCVRFGVQDHCSGFLCSDSTIGMEVPGPDLNGGPGRDAALVAYLTSLPFKSLTKLNKRSRSDAVVKSKAWVLHFTRCWVKCLVGDWIDLH